MNRATVGLGVPRHQALFAALLAAVLLGWVFLEVRTRNRPGVPLAESASSSGSEEAVPPPLAAPQTSTVSSREAILGAGVRRLAPETAGRVRVYLRVTDAASGHSMSEAPLEVRVRRHGGGEWDLACSTVTDHAGRAQVLVPFEAVGVYDGQTFGHIRARAIVEGYQRQDYYVSPKEHESTVELELALVRGGTLFGRLLDPDGNGVEGDLTLTVAQGDEEEVYSEKTGEFALHFDRERMVDIFAHAEGAGTARIVDYEVDFTTSAPLEIVLVGPGRVRGRVVDHEGRPAAGVELFLLAAELYDQWYGPPVATAQVLESTGQGAEHAPAPEEHRGLLRATTTTNDRGAFDVRGLRYGTYMVRARTSADGGYGHSAVLTKEPVLGDGSELELVFSRPHLVVSIRDANGVVLTGEVEIVRKAAPFEDEAEDAWPQPLSILVAPLPANRDFGDFGARTPGRSVGNGEYVFDVAEGRTYEVGLLACGIPWMPVEVDVPLEGGRVDVSLSVPERGASGTLQLDLAYSESVRSRPAIRIRVLDEKTGVSLVSRKYSSFRGGSPTLELPVGVYRVEVTGCDVFEPHHGRLVGTRRLDRWTSLARIEEGTLLAVAVTLAEGARLKLTLVGEPDESDLAACDPGWDQERRAEAARLATVHLVRDGVPCESVQFPHKSQWGSGQWSRLSLGSTETSQVVSTGNYLLEARLPGGRVASAPVTLAAGQIVLAELSFE